MSRQRDGRPTVTAPRTAESSAGELQDGVGRQVVEEETSTLLRGVSSAQLAAVTQTLIASRRRWFCAGQGRSGLVAQMTAMRLMHLGFEAHVVGEATAPSIGEGDGIILFSASGRTPVTTHIARSAQDAGALIIAITARSDSPLADLAGLVLEIPATGSRQFGGSLFEQGALLTMDSSILDIAKGAEGAYARMHDRHANLQ